MRVILARRSFGCLTNANTQSDPDAVSLYCGRRVVIEAGLDDIDVREVPAYGVGPERIEKPRRLVDGDDPAGWYRDRCQVDGCVARSAAGIDESLACRESRAYPRIEGTRPPDAML